MNYKNSLGRGFGLIVAAMMLSACSILPEAVTLAVYQLPSTSLASAGTTLSTQGNQQGTTSLQVDTPYAEHLLNSQRILVRPSGSRQVNVYQGAQWADSNPVLVRNRIVTILRQQAPSLIISTDSTRLQTKWRLKGELDEFQVNYDADVPVVHIRFNAVLVDATTNRALVDQSFAIQQPVNGTQLPEVVTAFGLATDQLSVALARWLSQQPLH